MIIGLFIRSFKTYQGLHFIPLSNEHNLCGLLGDNGIGKSSVLEAIDCFFNDRAWNLNNITKTKSTPYIVPVFAIDKNIENQEIEELFGRIDSIFRNIESADINIGGGDKSFKDIFLNMHKNAIAKFNSEDYYIIPIGIDDKRSPSFASLDSLFKTISEDDAKKALEAVKNMFDYVYIPKDIDSEAFTRLEAKQMQVLMGESLEKVLNDRITADSLREINNKLNDFISTLDTDLGEYAYRTPTEKQQNIRKMYMNNLFIESFFNIRKLHKKQNEHFIELNNLSSGEKQKALIDVAYKLLKYRRKNGNNLIIAIDEPESSLHISACFEQFNKLFIISRECRQVLFSSHWYGFLPILNKANVCIISKNENIHLFDLINLINYREEILSQIRYSEGKLPYHIGLKSITDLSHSI
ncbi:ATP-binding protein, partial [Pasteurella multocida]